MRTPRRSQDHRARPEVVEIKLSNGSVRRIRNMMATLFLGTDAVADLGKPELIKNLFFGFQKYLYQGPTPPNPWTNDLGRLGPTACAG
ncbi:hypothetical protein [Pseudomonas sp.]|uniref:hypothetical protein n=1 Tax=Pseudomonas sp. TaxID=306 RepID=UPI003BB4AF43